MSTKLNQNRLRKVKEKKSNRRERERGRDGKGERERDKEREGEGWKGEREKEREREREREREDSAGWGAVNTVSVVCVKRRSWHKEPRPVRVSCAAPSVLLPQYCLCPPQSPVTLRI